MSRIRHATETFVNNLIKGVKQLISSNTEQINVLFNQINSNGKQSLLPSNYLKKFLANHWDNIDGYNSSIIGFGGHSDASVPPFELIGNNKGLHYRIAVADGSKNEWQSTQQLATTTKTDILFQGAATTTFTLAKSFSGYDEFKVMGYTASHTHSTYTHNNFDFNTLGNTESGYLVFGVGVVQFQCNGTEFKILSNPNNVIISKIVAIKRGDK